MRTATVRNADDTLPTGTVDAVVIGGGSGLNGALMLARSRRSVVVIDSGSPPQFSPPRRTPAQVRTSAR